jgi:hypothetical protein
MFVNGKGLPEKEHPKLKLLLGKEVALFQTLMGKTHSKEGAAPRATKIK